MMFIESPPLYYWFTRFFSYYKGQMEKIARTPQTAFGGQLPFTGEPFRRSCAFTIQST